MSKFNQRKPELISIDKLKLNDTNPRTIRDENFIKLKKSLEDFPKMLEYRPIIVNKDMIVLGGNMRLRAAMELKYKLIPVVVADDLTDEEQRELIIKDNVGYGDWDWDMLANEYDIKELDEWGLDIPKWVNGDDDLDNFFDDENKLPDNKNKIVLQYTEEEYAIVMEAFNKHSGSKEQIIYKLLIG